MVSIIPHVSSRKQTNDRSKPLSFNPETTNDVYDLTGRQIIANATSEQIQKLDAGIYIVNGKKVLVK